MHEVNRDVLLHIQSVSGTKFPNMECLKVAAHLNYGGLVGVGQCGRVRHESVGGQLPPGQGNTHLTLHR